MRFEFLQALRDLDERTPSFYLQEMFAHGSLELRTDALSELQDLDPERETAAELRDMLRLIPD